MYMNYFESSQWAHIVKKWLSNKMKKTTSELEEKYPQPSKQGGQLEVLLGHLKDIPLSERYIRSITQTAKINAVRSYKVLKGIIKIQFIRVASKLRTQFRNGK